MSGFDNYSSSASKSITERKLERIDLIWIGSVIPGKYIESLKELRKLTLNSAIEINLWIDHSSKDANFSSFGELVLDGVKIKNTEDLLEQTIKQDFLNEEQKLNLVKILMFERAEPCNYAAISDFYRLLILIIYGNNCLYLDTDIQIKFTFSLRNLIAFYEDGLTFWQSKKNEIQQQVSSKQTQIELTEVLQRINALETTLAPLKKIYTDHSMKYAYEELHKKYRDQFSLELSSFIKNLDHLAAAKDNNCIIFSRFANNPILIATLQSMIAQMTDYNYAIRGFKFDTQENLLKAKKNPYFYDYKAYGLQPSDSIKLDAANIEQLPLSSGLTLMQGPAELWSKLNANNAINDSNPVFRIINDQNWIDKQPRSQDEQEAKYQEISELVKILRENIFYINNLDDMKKILNEYKYDLLASVEALRTQDLHEKIKKNKLR